MLCYLLLIIQKTVLQHLLGPQQMHILPIAAMQAVLAGETDAQKVQVADAEVAE